MKRFHLWRRKYDWKNVAMWLFVLSVSVTFWFVIVALLFP